MSNAVAHSPHRYDESLEISILKAEHVRGLLPREATVIVDLPPCQDRKGPHWGHVRRCPIRPARNVR